MSIWLNENTKAASKYRNEIEDLNQRLGEVKTPTELRAWNKEFTALKDRVQAAGDSGKSVFQSLLGKVKEFVAWTVSTMGVMAVVNTIRTMINTVKELDAAIVNLQMATNSSYESTLGLIQSYNQLAQQLGATTVEVAESANDWLRQGKSVEETNTLITNSMVLSKVGALDSASATQYLTSAMKGYSVATEDTIGIIDKLSSVDMVSATSAGDLATAMSYVANNANIAGVSMDKLIGYLATVGEVTQKSSETVGTSFNTIFSRMGSIKLKRLVDPETEEDLKYWAVAA